MKGLSCSGYFTCSDGPAAVIAAAPISGQIRTCNRWRSAEPSISGAFGQSLLVFGEYVQQAMKDRQKAAGDRRISIKPSTEALVRGVGSHDCWYCIRKACRVGRRLGSQRVPLL